MQIRSVASVSKLINVIARHFNIVWLVFIHLELQMPVTFRNCKREHCSVSVNQVFSKFLAHF